MYTKIKNSKFENSKTKNVTKHRNLKSYKIKKEKKKNWNVPKLKYSKCGITQNSKCTKLK